MKTVNASLFSACSAIAHTFTTRHGGHSKAPYAGNNLAFHVGDDKEVVVQNHKQLAQQIGYDVMDLVHMRQIHSDKVIIVDPKMHDFENPPECDALITNLTNIPLMVMVADCTPVLFFDPVQNVIGVAHAGRAGTLKGIVPKTIQKMHTAFGSSIDDILVVLGPSIGNCCYEIGKEIAQEVMHQGYASAVEKRLRDYYLDVKKIILHQLQESGVKHSHIEDLSSCNACHHHDYFSYRAEKQVTGRFSGIMMLRKVKL